MTWQTDSAFKTFKQFKPFQSKRFEARSVALAEKAVLTIGAFRTTGATKFRAQLRRPCHSLYHFNLLPRGEGTRV